MFASYDSQMKSQPLRVSGIRRMCRSRTLCTICVALLTIGFGFIRPAKAQERGAIGAALSAGLVVVDGNGAGVVGASGWYRLIPAFAIGANFGSTTVLTGVEQHGTEVVSDYSFEGFGEGRSFPSSPVGVFGRVSVGVAHVTLLSPSTGPLYDEEKNLPLLELEGGPELRVFFAPSTTPARPDLFFRARGLLTTMSGATSYGLGLSLGFEG
jgi:hypothetical protein